MSTATLNSLLEYLYGTLTQSDMRWVGEHLIERAERKEACTPKPYTIEELHARIAVSEQEMAEGKYTDFDKALDKIESSFTIKGEPTMAASV